MKITLELKPLESSFTLVDIAGVKHGIFSTEEEAMIAKPKIERNLQKFYDEGKLIYLKPKKKRRFKRRKNRR